MNSSNYYNSINDMPLSKWIQCTDGDLTGCRINGVGTPQMDELMWEAIYDSYIREMGLDKMYAKLLEVMKKKAQIECDYVLTSDRFKLTLLELEEEKLKTMIKSADSGKSGSINKSLVYVSKWVGSWLNPAQMSVKEYFVLLGEMEKINTNNT
jgi:hypothetical protein